MLRLIRWAVIIAALVGFAALAILGLGWWEVHRQHGATHRVRPSAVRLEWDEPWRWCPALAIRFTLRARTGSAPRKASVWWSPFAPPAPRD